VDGALEISFLRFADDFSWWVDAAEARRAPASDRRHS
jgi:hypothetical protein